MFNRKKEVKRNQDKNHMGPVQSKGTCNLHENVKHNTKKAQEKLIVYLHMPSFIKFSEIASVKLYIYT